MQLLDGGLVSDQPKLKGHIRIDGDRLHGRQVQGGEGHEGFEYLRLEEVAEGPAIHERLAGWVLGRVVVNHSVVRTVHLLQLFEQDGQVGESNSCGTEALLSDGADVSHHDVRIGEKLSVKEEEVRSSQSLTPSVVVGIDGEV